MAGKRKRRSNEFKKLIAQHQERLKEQWEKRKKRLELRFDKFKKHLDYHQNQLYELKGDIRSLRHQVAALTEQPSGKVLATVYARMSSAKLI